MTDLASIGVDYVFPLQTLVLDESAVAAYVEAVQDPFLAYEGPDGVVPPLAVLALAMQGLADLIARHPGSLHLTQQLEALCSVPVGSTVTATIRVRNRSERRGMAALTLDVSMDLESETALRGSMLLMVPLAVGSAHAE